MTKPVQIEYVQAIENTPVLPFVIDAYVALRKSGGIEAFACPATGDEEAFYVDARGKIVAALSFSVDGDTITVNMGYVAKAHRKRGLYRILWNRLVEEGRTRSLRNILGYHKPGNEAILGFNESVNRTIKYVCSEFTL